MSKTICFVLIVLFGACVSGSPDIADEIFDAALDKAMSGPVGEEDFQAALRSVAPRFPRVETSTGVGKATWTELKLNGRGRKVDAIRVRTPAGASHDLVWAFSLPTSVDRWYILPVEGKLKQGFRNFWKASPIELFGKEFPAEVDRGVIQMLDARHLEPDKEYLLWFVFKDEKPARTWVSIAFLPPGKSGSAKAAAKSLGLPRAVHDSKAETAAQP
jgi:hypothetical protein